MHSTSCSLGVCVHPVLVATTSMLVRGLRVVRAQRPATTMTLIAEATNERFSARSPYKGLGLVCMKWPPGHVIDTSSIKAKIEVEQPSDRRSRPPTYYSPVPLAHYGILGLGTYRRSGLLVAPCTRTLNEQQGASHTLERRQRTEYVYHVNSISSEGRALD